MAIARVNTAETFAAGSAGTIATAATSLTTGNRIVAVVRFTTGGQSVSGVADTAGNTYTQIRSATGGTTTTLQVWESNSVTGNGSNVVTATFSGNVTNRSICTVQYSGSADYDVMIDSAVGQDSGATITMALTVTEVDALVLAPVQVNATGGTWTPGSNLTSAVEDSSAVVMVQEAIVTSSTTITPAATSTSTAAKIAMCVVFRNPDGGSPSAAEVSHVFVG